MCHAVGFLFEPLVILHVQSHPAFLTLEAGLVPHPVQTVQFLCRINRLTARRARRDHCYSIGYCYNFDFGIGYCHSITGKFLFDKI